MKILLLNDTDNWAGTESHILDLATALRELGDDAAIACPPRSPLAHRASAIPVVPLEIRKTVDRRAIQKLARLLKSGRADVLHAHNGRTQLHGALAVAAARRGALVWTQHFIAPRHAQIGGRQAALMKRLHRAVNARTHGFIAISDAVKSAMIERGEAPAARIVVVPNGIADPRDAKLENPTTVRARYNVAPDAPLVVSLCRLEREKDVATLLRAWAQLKLPGARLLLAGRGAERDELQQQIENLNIGNAAQLVGFRRGAVGVAERRRRFGASGARRAIRFGFSRSDGFGQTDYRVRWRCGARNREREMRRFSYARRRCSHGGGATRIVAR